MDAPAVIAILFFVALIALVLIGLRRGRRRGAEISKWAEENRWQYTKSYPEINREWRAPVVRGGSVDNFLQKEFPEGTIFTFGSVYRIGTGPTLNRHVTGHYLGIRVPTVLILPAGEVEKVAPKYTSVEFDDTEFNAQWSVSTARPEDVSTVHELVTPRFRERLLGDDGLLRISSCIVFEDQYLLLITGGEMLLGNVDTAAELVRSLIRELPDSKQFRPSEL